MQYPNLGYIDFTWHSGNFKNCQILHLKILTVVIVFCPTPNRKFLCAPTIDRGLYIKFRYIQINIGEESIIKNNLIIFGLMSLTDSILLD